MSKARLFIDEDINSHALVQALRNGGIDCLTVAEAGRLGFSDEDQLSYAAETGRLLVSGNSRDFFRIHTEWLSSGRSHFGILLVSRKRRPIGPQIRGIIRFASQKDLTTIRNSISFIPMDNQPGR